MSRYLVDRIERTPRIEVHRHTEVCELVGDGTLEAIVVEDDTTGECRRLDVRALFVFIGAEPHTRWLADQVALDPRGFVFTGVDAGRSSDGTTESTVDIPLYVLETSRPGVFAAGDVRSGSTKRVASAVGEGSMAVRLIHERLAGTGARTGDSSAPSARAGPGRRSAVNQKEFLESVTVRGRLSPQQVERLTEATLTVLADRISAGEAEDLAAQLPKGVRDWLVSKEEPAQKFDLEDFIRRVSERAAVDLDTATRGTWAVLSTIRRGVTTGEFEDMLAQLPKEFRKFIG